MNNLASMRNCPGCEVSQIRHGEILATKSVLLMFTNMPADADKIFYCDSTFDNTVEVTKFNSY